MVLTNIHHFFNCDCWNWGRLVTSESHSLICLNKLLGLNNIFIPLFLSMAADLTHSMISCMPIESSRGLMLPKGSLIKHQVVCLSLHKI